MPFSHTKVALMSLEDLTIMIPTRNRPGFLKRALTYYVRNAFTCRFLIGDNSTTDALAAKTRTLCEELSDRLDIRYSFFDGSVSFGGILHALAVDCETDYAVTIGDDDFLISQGLSDCLRFLNDNPRATAVYGERVTLGVWGEPDESLDWIASRQYVSRTLSGDGFIDRVKGLPILAWNQQLHSVHRRHSLVESLSIIRDKRYSTTAEYFLYAAILTFGDWVKIDSLFAVCSQDTKFYTYRDRSSFIYYWGTVGRRLDQISLPFFSEDLNALTDATAALHRKNETVPENADVRTQIIDLFWAHTVQSINERGLEGIFIRRSNAVQKGLYRLQHVAYMLWLYALRYSPFTKTVARMARFLLKPIFWKILVFSQRRDRARYLFSTALRHNTLDYSLEALLDPRNKNHEDFMKALDCWRENPMPQQDSRAYKRELGCS